jgi:hypothetical protein
VALSLKPPIIQPCLFSNKLYRKAKANTPDSLAVKSIGKPDAGNLHVRFDEREQETGPCQAGLRRSSESLANRHRKATATAPVLDSTRRSLLQVLTQTLQPTQEDKNIGEHPAGDLALSWFLALSLGQRVLAWR